MVTRRCHNAIFVALSAAQRLAFSGRLEPIMPIGHNGVLLNCKIAPIQPLRCHAGFGLNRSGKRQCAVTVGSHAPTKAPSFTLLASPQPPPIVLIP